jgi:hypothetical protein
MLTKIAKNETFFWICMLTKVEFCWIFTSTKLEFCWIFTSTKFFSFYWIFTSTKFEFLLDLHVAKKFSFNEFARRKNLQGTFLQQQNLLLKILQKFFKPHSPTKFTLPHKNSIAFPTLN